MRKTMVVFVVVAIGLLGAFTAAHAQDKDAAADQAKQNAAQDSKAQADRNNTTPYRLDFSFYELEDAKKINTRHYTLNLTVGTNDELKIGTRVPVATGRNSADPSFNFQYMDVGTTLWADLRMWSGDLRLEVHSDVSNLDLAAEHDRSPGTPPIVRHIQINGTTLLVTGKPILIGSMDDPNSNRQFQLEVTATKLR